MKKPSPLSQERPIIMLDERHKIQPLCDLTGLKFILVAVPELYEWRTIHSRCPRTAPPQRLLRS